MHALAITDNAVTLYRHDWAHQYQANQLGECARAVFYALKRPMGPMPHPSQPDAMASLKAVNVYRLYTLDPSQDSIYSVAAELRGIESATRIGLADAMADFDPFPEWAAMAPNSLGALLRLAMSLQVLHIDRHADPEQQLITIGRYDRHLCLAQGFTCGRLDGWIYSLGPADAFDLAGLPWEHLQKCARAFLGRHPGANPWT
jgi:hypothetical protein